MLLYLGLLILLSFVTKFNTMVPPLNVISLDTSPCCEWQQRIHIYSSFALGIASVEYDKASLLTCISVEHLLIYIFLEI